LSVGHGVQSYALQLGRTLTGNKLVTYDGEGSLLTVGDDRGSNVRGLVIPNLLSWPGSIVVIDPRGSSAVVTADRRGTGGGGVKSFLGQSVHILDPFGVVEGVKTAGWNPLSAIDTNGEWAREDIGLIADALVPPERGIDAYWSATAKTVLSGVIAHVLSVDPGASLVDVRKALMIDGKELDGLFEAMRTSGVAGGLAAAAGSVMTMAGKMERESHLTTLGRSTAWVDDPGMTATLRRGDFRMTELRERPTSVYVVLSPERLAMQQRFLRLVVNSVIMAAERGGRSNVPTLLLLDEFEWLGELGTLAGAHGALAPYRLKLWAMVQGIGRLCAAYPKDWQRIVSNSGVVQIVGVDDRRHLNDIEVALGMAAGSLDDLVKDVPGGIAGDGSLQIVLRPGEAPALLRASYYDRDPDFSEEMYASLPQDAPGGG